jgi:hypothetical protein
MSVNLEIFCTYVENSFLLLYQQKKNLEILQSRVFLSLVSEREHKNLLVVSSAPPPNVHHDFIKKYISLRLHLDMSSLNSSPVDTNALNGSFQCAAGIYCLLPLVNYADSCHRCFSVKVLSMDHVVCCMIRTISHIKMAVIYVITSIFPIKEFLQIRQHS